MLTEQQLRERLSDVETRAELLEGKLRDIIVAGSVDAVLAAELAALQDALRHAGVEPNAHGVKRLHGDLVEIRNQRDEFVRRLGIEPDPAELPLTLHVENCTDHNLHVDANPVFGRVLATGEVRGPIRLRLVITEAPHD